MTLEGIWEQLVRKNPSLARSDVTVEFSPQNLKALLRQVYEQGQNSVATHNRPFSDMFNEMFGGRKR